MIARAWLPGFVHIVVLTCCWSLAAPASAAETKTEPQPERKLIHAGSRDSAAAGQTEVAPKAVAPQATGSKQPDWAAGPVPSWIWGADANKNYVVRKTFQGGSKDAWLIASCDNVMQVFINGQSVASDDSWNSPSEINVQKFMKDGENVVLAEISNQGAIAAFVLKLALSGADGQTRYEVSDDSWQVAASRDAKDWVPARVVAKYGSQPWGTVFSNGAKVASSTAARDIFNVLPGFQVERLFTVPKEELGSWVCHHARRQGPDHRQRSGTDKGLCRITPPPIGSQEPTKVERLDVKISSRPRDAVGVRQPVRHRSTAARGSGLYRLRDTNGDDQFDEVVKLEGDPRRRRARPARAAAVARRQEHLRAGRQPHQASVRTQARRARANDGRRPARAAACRACPRAPPAA